VRFVEARTVAWDPSCRRGDVLIIVMPGYEASRLNGGCNGLYPFDEMNRPVGPCKRLDTEYTEGTETHERWHRWHKNKPHRGDIMVTHPKHPNPNKPCRGGIMGYGTVSGQSRCRNRLRRRNVPERQAMELLLHFRPFGSGCWESEQWRGGACPPKTCTGAKFLTSA
jgi:hypothetical protein